MNDLKTILIVDDELAIRRFLRASLSDGFSLFEAETGAQAIQGVARQNPDLMLLDLGLPDMDGLEVTRQVREWSLVPIIILSARGQEQDKILALDAGADDYLTKPFAIGELQARIRAALRHAKAPQETGAIFSSQGLEVDHVARRVTVRGTEIKLTPIEYRLLSELVRHAGLVLTHRHLLTHVWGPEYADEMHYLRVYMGQLRHKLETEPARPQHLITEPGVGYRLRIVD